MDIAESHDAPDPSKAFRGVRPGVPAGLPSDLPIRRPRLRTYLLGLVLALLLPALAIGGVGIWHAVGSYGAAFEARLRDAARMLALALDNELGALRQGLVLLADQPALDPGAEPPLQEARLRAAAAVLGTPVGLFATDGRVLFHTALPPGAPLPGAMTGMDGLRQAVATRAPVILDLVESTVARRPMAAMLVPVLRDGGVAAVLGVRLDPERLRGLLRVPGAESEGVAALLDARSRFVARSEAHEAYLGETAMPWFVDGMARTPEGLLRGRTRDGDEIVLGHATLAAAPGWKVAVAVPAVVHRQAILRPALILVGAGLVLLLAGMAVAMAFSRRLAGTVSALAARARAVSAGLPAPETTPPAPVAEFEAMRRDLMRAEVSVRDHAARTRALADAAELERRRLRLTFEGVPQALATFDAAGRLLDLNQSFARLYGFATPAEALMPLRRYAEVFEARDRAGRALAQEERPVTRALRGETVLDEEIELRRRADGTPLFLGAFSAAPLRDAAGQVVQVVLSIQDLTERRRSERRETLLMREVDHRAKNMLAVLRAALRLTRAGNRQELVQGLDGRIAALARAQTALAERHWDHAGLRALLEGELSPAPGGGEARAVLEGPDVALPPDTAQPLALAVHELAANAMQHGALSVPEGRLRVTWRVEDGLLRLLWEEGGGPAPERPPARRGFGLRLLEATLNRQLGGRVEQRWTPGGLHCEIALPLGRDAEAALAAE